MIVDKDWFFITHRMNLAKSLQQNGASVYVATQDTGHKNRIEAAGFEWLSIHSSRNSINPLKEIRLIYQISDIIGRIKPDIVHIISIKMMLPGLIALAFHSKPVIICSITGLGSLFLGRKRHITNFLLDQIMLWMKHRILFIFQNNFDQALFVQRKWTNHTSAFLIRGSGVVPEEFAFSPIPANETPIVLFASRLTAHKGIYEFAEAASKIAAVFPAARFQIAGRLVYDNPTSLTEEKMGRLVAQHPVTYLGNITNMADLLTSATIVVLPTHGGEGVPKVLIEAAFIGRPIVATDVPGCSDIVDHGITGLLVPPQNSAMLGNAILSLLQNKELMTSMGKSAHQKAIASFSMGHVIESTLTVYEQAIQNEK